MKSGSLKERIADKLNYLKSFYLPVQLEKIAEVNQLLDDLSRAEVIEVETKKWERQESCPECDGDGCNNCQR